ncbi:hypothetical protein [Sulfurimonas sp.]|uniref:hypothetical protein n=1 Tax=Sulfurimonas sp. TaxID=2022749 RepID=UPI002618E7F0|nr:hypothetical protein [Sulfurimonas sp.]
MSETVEKLKKIGAQKISEDTHIPIVHIQAILDEDFDGFTRVQFIGFIGILQREYNLNLDELKEQGLLCFKDEPLAEEIFDAGVFGSPKKSINLTIVYIVIAIIIFLVALYYTLGVAQNSNEKRLKVDNTTIEKAAKNIKKPLLAKIEVNATSADVVEVNLTKVEKKTPSIKKEKAVVYSLEVMPRSKVWLGYVDVETNKKYQRTFKTPFELDPKKEWILMFGHGYVDVNLNGKKIKFNNKNTLRLWYKDGKLQEISADEFKRLNRGRRW